MIRLGAVIHVTASKRLIVQSTKIPRFGSIVFDEEGEVGVVKDIFGPKAHPFISIAPKISLNKANELVGKKLFYRDNQRKKKYQRQNRRSSRGPRKTRKTRKPRSP